MSASVSRSLFMISNSFAFIYPAAILYILPVAT